MRFPTALFLCALPAVAAAQERPNTMIVLDGSGSMWGQIEGVNKIVIARDVLGGILDDFPAEENLGLTVYGHRERGNCADIETVVQSGPGTVDAIRQAAGAINPRGKTPMTDAIIAAAEALRYTEERATVILVSDGIETCNPDPCAAATALEEAGIDFTAHVVGFDVTDPEALAQMQCLAGNTGGTFTTASNADELTQALAQVTVAEPEPEPEPVLITFSARIGAEDGPVIGDPVIWTVGEANGDAQGNPIEVEMDEGSYTVEAYWTVQEVAVSRQFVVTDQPREIAVVFEEPKETATITAPDSALAGTTVEIGWNGPNADGDFIAIKTPEAEGYHRFINTTATKDGNPVNLLMPIPPGAYLVEYISAKDRVALASQSIEVTPLDVSVTAPATADAGSTVEIGWTGPGYRGDFIAVRAPDAEGYHRFTNTAGTDDGNPLKLLMPSEPGEYLIEYIAGQNREPLAVSPVTVSAVSASLTAPTEASAGATIEVGWTGPGYKGDFIAVRAPDAEGYHRFTNTVAAEKGNPSKLLMPSEPGEYVIEYIEAQDRTPMAAVPITISSVAVSVTAPAEAAAGSTIEVGWSGPDYKGDFVAVRAPDAEGYHRFTNTVATEKGNPAKLLMPSAPGDYVIEYIEAQDRTPLAAQPITISAVSSSLTAPAEAPAGATIEVGWTGPDYRGDFIAVRAPEAEGYHRFTNTVATDKGNPAKLLMPSVPGTYVIEYIEAQDRSPLSVSQITIAPVTASLTAPTSAAVDSTIEVGWNGPDYRNDFIAIRAPGSEGYHRFAKTIGTGRGNPAKLAMPSEPGTYLIEYIEGQDRTPLAVQEITIE